MEVEESMAALGVGFVGALLAAPGGRMRRVVPFGVSVPSSV
jgi:hypothetical protein